MELRSLGVALNSFRSGGIQEACVFLPLIPTAPCLGICKLSTRRSRLASCPTPVERQLRLPTFSTTKNKTLKLHFIDLAWVVCPSLSQRIMARGMEWTDWTSLVPWLLLERKGEGGISHFL